MYQISPGFCWKQSLNPLTPIRKVFTQRPLFGLLFRNDLTAKFRHSLLGVCWLFIPPLSILLIYVYMFSVIFQLRWPEAELSSRWGFGLAIYAGITVFSAFSDSVMGSLNLLVSRSGSLKRVPFPWELLPMSLVCANMLIAAVVLLLLFVLSLLTGGSGSWMSLVWFPVIFLPFLLLTVGCCWFAAALGLFFRDLGNLFGIILLLLFFSTPIFYSVRMVPESFHVILELNPLTPTVINIRNILLQNSPPSGGHVLSSILVGIVFFQAGFCFFEKMRRRFADVV